MVGCWLEDSDKLPGCGWVSFAPVRPSGNARLSSMHYMEMDCCGRFSQSLPSVILFSHSDELSSVGCQIGWRVFFFVQLGSSSFGGLIAGNVPSGHLTKVKV